MCTLSGLNMTIRKFFQLRSNHFNWSEFKCSNFEKQNTTLNPDVGFVTLVTMNIKIMVFWAWCHNKLADRYQHFRTFASSVLKKIFLLKTLSVWIIFHKHVTLLYKCVKYDYCKASFNCWEIYFHFMWYKEKYLNLLIIIKLKYNLSWIK